MTGTSMEKSGEAFRGYRGLYCPDEPGGRIAFGGGFLLSGFQGQRGAVFHHQPGCLRNHELSEGQGFPCGSRALLGESEKKPAISQLLLLHQFSRSRPLPFSNGMPTKDTASPTAPALPSSSRSRSEKLSPLIGILSRWKGSVACLSRTPCLPCRPGFPRGQGRRRMSDRPLKGHFSRQPLKGWGDLQKIKN
jgi:hypothetical protein